MNQAARHRAARATSSSIVDRLLRRLDRLRHPEGRLSFAQEAEDLVLLRTLRLPQGRTPFYVDVGAHDPKWYSNTFVLYQSGWRGVNIDATPGVAERFRQQRPDDLSIEAAIGSGSTCEFVDFHDHAISGLAGTAIDEATAQGQRVKSRRTVTTVPLGDILAKHLPPGQAIDLLSVGGAVGLDEAAASPTTTFLKSHDYVPYAKTGLTVLFASASRIHRGQHCFEIHL